MKGKLFILGNFGGGKIIILLELVRRFVIRVEKE